MPLLVLLAEPFPVIVEALPLVSWETTTLTVLSESDGSLG
jgi:Flp pilus assembly CpaE family ATPase